MTATTVPAGATPRPWDTAWRLLTTSRPVQLAILLVFVAGWLVRLIVTYYNEELGGLFRWIGIDFGFYLAQAHAFADGRIDALYSIDILRQYEEALVGFTNSPGVPLPTGPVPYPPVFAWLLSPLAGVGPPVAFAIWTLASVVAAGALAWRVMSFFPPERKLLAATLLLVSTPLVFSLWFGQVQIFLALAFGEAFLAMRKGRDLSAGLWLSILLIKPQYLLIVIPLLVWKLRLRAIAGFVAGGLLLLAISALVAGPASVGAYLGSFVESATASGGDAVFTAVAPDVMVNWRALVIAVPLDIPNSIRVAITLVLSGLTVLAVLAACRGPWLPTGPKFAGQMTLVAIGTVLASYHSHVHGAVMIAVPLAAYLSGLRATDARERMIDMASRIVLAAAIVAPWFWFAVLGHSHTRANGMLAITLVLGLFLILARLMTMKPAPSEEVGAPDPAAPPGSEPATASSG